MRVGNLAVKRAIKDVMDLVWALELLAEIDELGGMYKICGETASAVGDLIQI